MGSSLAMLAAVVGCESEVEQALSLLAEAGVDEPAALSLADGDRRLLSLCRGLTGREPEVTAACPACGTENAVALTPEAVPPAAPRCARLGAGGGLRQPTYGDLTDLPDDEASVELLRRCTVGSPGRGARAADLELVDDSLSGPLVLTCAECGDAVEVGIDAQRLALELLQRYAAEVDHEAHLLASAYGWELDAIEGLSDERRRRLAGLIRDER